MYGATITVLESMVQEGSSNSICGEAGGCLIVMKSFEFIFILYLIHKIIGITDLLCRVLQQKSLNILNAMDLVSTTKALLRTLRDVGFDLLLANVQSVCTKYKIDIPHMNASYKKATGHSYQQQGSVTIYQRYHYDIFNSTIDFQLEELNFRFSNGIVEHVKIVLRNKMKEEFLADSLMIYIERELVEDIDSDSIIDELYSTKHRRVQL
jgi:hypothetical protein